MKLKQLTIHNIASIEDATICFDAEPLASSEVYLITGKTGAGKSTILDAICLALYADTPRLDGTNMQGILADQDKEVKVNDPRQLMRRNTGEAFVRLTFTGINGIPYEATWSVARARNKSNGNLQAKKWCLRNVKADFTYSKDEEIKAEIRRAVGLDFKQFCRTTMLAQGEFTRFLNSKDDEKADILEKITGADIYSRIGAKIFAQAKEHKEQWEQAEQQARSVQVLSEEEQQAKREECTRIEREQTRNRREQERTQAILTWMDREQELAQKAVQAQKQLQETEARTGSEAFRKEHTRNRLWRATQEARGWVAEHAQAHSRIGQQQEVLDALRQEYLVQRRVRDALRKDAECIAQAIRHMQAGLESEAHLASIYANAQSIVSQLEMMADCDRKAQEAQLEDKRLARQIEDELQPKCKEAGARLVKHVDKQDALGKDIAREEQALLQLHLPQLRLAGEQNATLLTHISTATDAIHTYACELERDRMQRRKIEETEREIAQRRQQVEKLLPKIHDAELVVQTLQAALQKEQEKVSDWAKRLRVKLQVGDVCPVCLHKIDSELPHEDLLAELVAESEQRFARAQKMRDELQQQRVALEASVTALVSSLAIQKAALDGAGHLTIAAQKARASVDACLTSGHCEHFHIYNKERSEVLGRWERFLQNTSQGEREEGEPAPEACDSVLVMLASMGARVQEELQSQRQKIQEAELKEVAVRRLRAEADTLAEVQKSLSEAAQKAESALEKAKGRRETQQAAIRLLGDNRSQAATQVEALMSGQDGKQQWSCDWHTSPREFARLLQAAAEAYSKRSEELRKLVQKQEREAGRLSSLSSATDTIEQMMPAWGRLQANSPATAADTDLDTITLHASTLLGRIGSAQEQLQLATRQAGSLEQLLLDYARSHPEELQELSWLREEGECGSTPVLHQLLDSLRWLNSLSQKDIEESEHSQDEILNSRIRQHALLEEASRQQKEHLQQKPQTGEEDTADALLVRMRLLTTEADELARRKGGVQRDLKVDQQNRQTAGKLLELAKAKRDEYARWDRLNQLLGDATGSKFRKIAQSYVLANLLRSANAYLRTLTERYSLQVAPGSFAISLTDAYQGYATRAATTLSGGESFLVSLSLALALSDIDSRLSVDTLFIDEGFGTLSGEPLQNAISTLRSLHTKAGKHVGIISHVDELKECIPVQIMVNQEGNNSSSEIEVKG